MTVRFELPLHVNFEWGMNRVYSGDHWSIRKQQAAQVHILVKAAIRKQCRNVPVFGSPVTVRIRYNSRLDIDNHGYITKLIIDGMKGLLIKDDDKRYVRELIQCFHTLDKQKIIVEVWDEKGEWFR